MLTEKLDNVEALKIGEDANNQDVVEPERVHHAKIWTGIVKEDPGQYFRPIADHAEGGELRDILLIQIQPTRLKQTVWLMGGWINQPHMTTKGTRVQFSLDPSPDNKFQNKDGHILAESRLGTMAAKGDFE